tara:strand:+ start:5047 stop:6288 length:1242 start_codon:yes stop_codon:yes gene_type:complete
MHLKKGDVVAIVATVVEQQSAKVEVSINGAEIDTGLIVPAGVLRLLERSAAHGDKVILPDGRKGTYFQALNDNVVIVLLDDADERDPNAYVNVLRDNLRNQNQEGVVQFAPIKKPVAGAETGRDILDATAGDEAPEVESAVQENHDTQEELNDTGVNDDENGHDAGSIEEDTKVEALAASVDFEFPIQLGGESRLETEEDTSIEEAFDKNEEEAADEITVEMPDAPLPRRPAPTPDDDVNEEAPVDEEALIDASEEVSAETERADEITPGEATSTSDHENNPSEDERADSADEASPVHSSDGNETSSVDKAPVEENGQAVKQAEDEAAKDASDMAEEEPAPEAEAEAAEAPQHEPEPVVAPDPARDPERTAHLESMKKDMLAGIREQEGQTEDPSEDGDDIFSSIDSLDKRMS